MTQKTWLFFKSKQFGWENKAYVCPIIMKPNEAVCERVLWEVPYLKSVDIQKSEDLWWAELVNSLEEV